MQKHFDLVVIGSGPGGLKAAIQAAKLGKSVALIEKGRPGGSSVHTGTIPSKSLREAALACQGRSQKEFATAMARMRSIVTAESKVVKAQLERNKVQLVEGEASFTAPHEIQVKGKQSFRVRAESFVIATGTRPIRHAEFPFRLKGLHDSDSLLKIKELPRRLLVMGAGVIGCEYASIFARLGAEVVLVDRRAELLRSVDFEVIAALKREFAASGVHLALGSDFGAIQAGKGSANLEVKIDGRLQRFQAALVCMGRQPNTESLHLDKAGVKTDQRGYVEVDRMNFRTSAPHIHAVGDVIGPPGLAAAAAEQGRIASCSLFGAPCSTFPASFPYGIYTIPEISSVGLLETEARERNIPYVVGRAEFREVARGLIVGDSHGFIKLLVRSDNRRLIGVHAIGHGASELVHIGQAVLALQAPVDYLVENVFNYPTFAEAYKVAALHAVNQMKA